MSSYEKAEQISRDFASFDTARCESSFWVGMEPEPLLSVSEWADQYRVLSQRASSEPGTWRTSRTPYLKEIMDSLSATSPIQEIIVMKGAQLGFTEAGNNWIGYVIDHAAAPMLAVQPTVEMAKRNSKQRIEPLIDECPRLREKVKEKRSRDSGNTILAKEFPGGVLVMTGANSAVGLRSLPARYLFLDEVDAYPGDVDGEGDPVLLAKARSRTFGRRKIYQVSTPTFSGRSRIEGSYENSDQRKYYVPCPFCEAFQILQWSQLVWLKGESHQVKYKCIECETLIDEHYKTRMLELGEWRAGQPGFRGGKIAGYHLNSLYSPLGWFSWSDAAQLWEDAQGKPDSLRGFINTVLGETWKEKGDAPDWSRLYERRENYELNKVPKKGLFLTAGVDVQKDRLELEIVAWGRNKTSYSIDYRVIPGDTSSAQPWTELERVLHETWPHESGCRLPLKLMAIDSGFNTQHVYSWCRKFSMTKVIAIKGQESSGAFVGQPKPVDVSTHGKTINRGLKVWPVGTSLIKPELYGFLRQPVAPDGEEEPIGFCHFPQYGEEYFKQLTAEELVVRIVKGYRRYEWQKIRERNEALDTRVYARAAAYICGIDRFTEQRWQHLECELGNEIPQPTSRPVINEKPTSATRTEEPIQRRKPSSFWNNRDHW